MQPKPEPMLNMTLKQLELLLSPVSSSTRSNTIIQQRPEVAATKQ
jgi:hypothetical protein